MRKILIIGVSIFCIFADTGKYGSERFEFGYSARVQAMGSAFSAGEKDLTGVFLNPAILSSINSLKAEGSYSIYYGNLFSSGSVNLCIPQKNYNIGLSVFFLQVPDIPHTEVTDPDSVNNFDDIILKGYFSSYTYIFNLSFSKSAGNLTFGANMKMVYEDILDENGKGVGFDIGVIKTLNQRTRIGLSLQNVFGTYMIWTTGRKEAFNPFLNIGISLFPVKNLATNFDVSIKTENIRSSSFFSLSFLSLHPRIGFEWNLFKYLNLRGGMEESLPALGLGFNFKNLEINYALRYSLDLGDSHIITLSYNR